MSSSHPIERPRIQIAGVIDESEARLLLEEGVDDLGFPLGPGVVKQDLTETEATRILHSIPAPAGGVLITYLSQAAGIVDFCRRLGARKVQVHGDFSPEEAARLKERAPDLFVLKSLVVRQDNLSTLEAALDALSPFVDAFITDTYDPATGQRGATGKVHDWTISARLVALSHRPIILAGGLTPDNVAEAIARVRPAGVDSHTGVEGPDGRKDRARVRRFVEQARRAFDHVKSHPDLEGSLS